MSAPLLQLTSVTQSFSGVRALKGMPGKPLDASEIAALDDFDVLCVY